MSFGDCVSVMSLRHCRNLALGEGRTLGTAPQLIMQSATTQYYWLFIARIQFNIAIIQFSAKKTAGVPC